MPFVRSWDNSMSAVLHQVQLDTHNDHCYHDDVNDDNVHINIHIHIYSDHILNCTSGSYVSKQPVQSWKWPVLI